MSAVATPAARRAATAVKVAAAARPARRMAATSTGPRISIPTFRLWRVGGEAIQYLFDLAAVLSSFA
jgi:hypothetical protein